MEPQVMYIRKVLPVHNRADVIVDDQDLSHIIKSIKYYHKRHKPQYDDISAEFNTGTGEHTAQQLFNFCKKYITYKVEPESDQTIKSPGRLIDQGFGDCKHYASFIVGVLDSLNRQGVPIEAHYKFVSDDPGKDVHHVFAVVKADGKEYWVDPVLQEFDERPKFHNHKDIFFNNGIGRLTYLSGTAASVGKFSFKNAIKNFGKQVEHTVYKGTKAIKKAADDVKHLAFKVTFAAGRNATLALIDINAFNLATRFNNALKSNKRNGLINAWRDAGGEPGKLISAVNNGMKHKAFYNRKPAAKRVNGLNCSDCIGMGAVYHSRWITTHPERWAREYPILAHRRRYHRKELQQGRVSGAMIGEPVSAATLMALASSILAILSKFLTAPTPEEAGAMTDQARQGIATITDQAAAADAAEGQGKADQLNRLTAPGGGNTATMQISTGTDDTGAPQVTVHDVDHPALNNGGNPGGGAASDIAADGTGTGIMDEVKAAAVKYWKPAVGIGAGIAAIKFIILPMVNKKRKR